MLRFTISSLEELRDFAALFAQHLKPGSSIGLNGSLGAGKTEFVRQLLLAFGEEGDVVSPSYALEVVYEVDRKPKDPASAKQSFELSHWDVYRLSGSERVPEDLLERIGESKTVTIVEWPSLIDSLSDLLDLQIFLKINSDDSREVEVEFRAELAKPTSSSELSAFQELYSDLAQIAQN